MEGNIMADGKSIHTALMLASLLTTAATAVAADVNNDNKPDYLVTVRGHLAVYDNSGEKLWLKKTDIAVGGQSESQGRRKTLAKENGHRRRRPEREPGSARPSRPGNRRRRRR